MSSPTTSRASARNNQQRSSTPDQRHAPLARTASASVAPKSEYLRNALQARRAQNAPSPAPTVLDMRIPPSSTPKPPENNLGTTSPDGFDEFELKDEHTRPVSPIYRRRTSDVGVHHSKTSRQLTEEIERLKDTLMTSNMRVELLKKNNSELQHTTTRLKERLEELEPLEEENNELRDENHHLRLKMQDLEEELERTRDDNEELRKSNEDMLAINVECSSHWDDQETAVQEAADAIIALEKEKATLADEFRKLKDRVTQLEMDSPRGSFLVDGSPRAPSTIYSIDDSRPSTSHFDSDYYSQPDSPQVKSSKESVSSVTPSARSKKFLEKIQEQRRSTQDLAKRMSTASIGALRLASLKHADDIPEVPKFQIGAPRPVAPNVSDRRTPRGRTRYHQRRLPEGILQEALELSPTVSETTLPDSRTTLVDGVRQASRSDQFTANGSSSDSRPLSSGNRTPTATRVKTRRPSTNEVSLRVPSRRSSKQAHTNSSNEQLSQSPQPPRHRQSESDVASAETPRAASEEWASTPPSPVPARSSVISSSSLTSDTDLQDKDRWWRSVQPLTHQQQRALSSQPQQQPTRYQPPSQLHIQAVARLSEGGHQPQQSPTLIRTRSHHTDGHGQSARIDTTGAVSASQTFMSRRTRTQPNTPAATSPHLEKDFMFNTNEDVDTFMRKARAKLSGRR
ncbi:hypothetical protein ACEQ8H_003522 [Pleosporales sp. CAS-2024a]